MLRLFILIILSVALVNCANVAPPSSKPVVERSYSQRQQLLSRIDQFHIMGKMAFKTNTDSGSATLNWNENRGQYRVALLGPLGSHSVTILGQNGSVLMETGNGERVHAASAEALIAKELGYPLPVSYLKYWIKGIPVPYLASDQILDGEQRIQQLQQAGWKVRFATYRNIGTIDLPTRIQLVSRNIQAKIIIYDWQLK